MRTMTIKLDGLSAKELEALISQASQRKKQLAKRKPVAVVKQKLAALAKAEGYSLAEIFGGSTPAGPKAATAKPRKAVRAASSAKGSKVPPKYRNPANAAQTWAGRGQQPKWLAAEIARGRKLADFSIV
jgi:DNA-binding protein H-NS